MPLYPHPWGAYKSAIALKSACLELDKKINDLDLNILKQLQELEGLEERETEVKRKQAEVTSKIIADHHASELKRIPESRARANAWLAVNRAKKAQLLVEHGINSREYGELQKDIWTCDEPEYKKFRDLLEKMD